MCWREGKGGPPSSHFPITDFILHQRQSPSPSCKANLMVNTVSYAQSKTTYLVNTNLKDPLIYTWAWRRTPTIPARGRNAEAGGCELKATQQDPVSKNIYLRRSKMVGRPAVAASSQWLVGMRKRYCNSVRHTKQVNLRSYDVQDGRRERSHEAASRKPL